MSDNLSTAAAFTVIGHIQRVRYELADAEHQLQAELDRRREGGA